AGSSLASPLTTGETINSLLMVGDGINVNGAVVLTLGSGTIATTGAPVGDQITLNPSTTTGVALSVEGKVLTNAGATLNLNAVLTGAAGLTTGGTGTLNLNDTNANQFTGAVTLNSGTVQLGNNNSLGAATNAVTIIGGTLQASLSGVNLANPLTLTTG